MATRINISTLPETNVDWFADGERANALVLNRPLKDVAGIINGVMDEVDTAAADAAQAVSDAAAASSAAAAASSAASAASAAAAAAGGLAEESFAGVGSFPGTGVAGTVYTDTNTGDTYAWNGSAYILIEIIDPTELSTELDNINGNALAFAIALG